MRRPRLRNAGAACSHRDAHALVGSGELLAGTAARQHLQMSLPCAIWRDRNASLFALNMAAAPGGPCEATQAHSLHLLPPTLAHAHHIRTKLSLLSSLSRVRPWSAVPVAACQCLEAGCFMHARPAVVRNACRSATLVPLATYVLVCLGHVYVGRSSCCVVL